ncbi:uncharacterized protein FIESC28_11740 [Fusarium coffeatum]|uniref:Azaphilone pigments biosynthesis cluster protein L N-terminal domain-containing protein n=1 Tax=Fusarium coffeatum TaxID=231269 RepID=A0A366QFC6_9HYPO|nr:uncharacterized protein FIESC28_11740 [Fusarium coffeatum]RBR03583.1 hypothetical protein FIESC28_11740 [Fusarium coffeatum]
MEAIGAGASTLAFVLLALKSAKVINESLSSIKDAPRTVIELLEDMKFLQSILERLSQCTLQHASISTVDSLTQTLQGCTTELSSIEGRLAKFLQDTVSSRSRRVYKGVLAYIKKEDLENARRRVRDKSTQINLYLGLLQAQSMSELSSQVHTQAIATTSILEEILNEVSRIHARISHGPVPGIEEHSDVADDAIVNNLEALMICSELDSSISRLSALVGHDGLSLDAEDAEQIIDDLRRFVVVAREKSVANAKLKTSDAYSIGAESSTKLVSGDFKLIEGLIISAPIIAINKSVASSRKLLSHLPQGAIIKQKRIREQIDVDQGYLTISTNKRRRVCSGAPKDSSGNTSTYRDVVANIVFRPSNSPWMFSVSLSQGQLFDRSIQSIPRISVCRIIPNDSPVFDLVKRGLLDDFRSLLQEGKASLRDHDEQGMPLLHYAATASVEMCKFLIESGADVDEMGENTGTALSRIAGLDRHDTTLLLLENMADPTLSYPGWDNPLYTACSLDLPSAELFLRHGRHFTLHDLESYDLNGRTRLHQICMAETKSTSKKKALEILTSAGANLSARVIKSWSPDDHQTLGFTCLHSLVYKAHRNKDRDELEALVFLIRQGADVLSVDHHQHSVSMRAYLPNDNDNQYSSKGSYRGDLWDAALSLCGYDISEHRAMHPRVPRYNKSYRRKDFERLWQGREPSCPYWDDERYPKVGGDESFWKQPIRRCDHVACSDCEDPQAEAVDLEKEDGLDADVPGYALDIYRHWALEASEPEVDVFDLLRQRESPVSIGYELCDLMSLPDRDDYEFDQAFSIWEREQEELEQQEHKPEVSEDGEEAFERLVVEPMMNDLEEQMETNMLEGSGEDEEQYMFLDQWLEYYNRAAEEEREGYYF